MSPEKFRKLRAPLRIRLDGPAVFGHRIKFEDLVLFGTHLQSAVDRIARVLLGENSSAQPGRKPSEIKAACALEIVEITGGSIDITCDLPLQRQMMLVDDLGEQSLATLVAGLGAVGSAQGALPPGFDKGVLLALREGGKLFDHGIDRIEFELQTRKGQVRNSYTKETHRRVVERIQGPVANRRTIEGRLLMGDFKESGFRCRVHPPAARPVTCAFEDAQREAILAAMTRFVRIVGEAIEADGEISLLKVEDIEILDREDDSTGAQEKTNAFFDPAPSLQTLAAQQGVSPVHNLDALFGDFWPQEESADEFIDAVRKWRHEGEQATK